MHAVLVEGGALGGCHLLVDERVGDVLEIDDGRVFVIIRVRVLHAGDDARVILPGIRGSVDLVDVASDGNDIDGHRAEAAGGVGIFLIVVAGIVIVLLLTAGREFRMILPHPKRRVVGAERHEHVVAFFDLRQHVGELVVAVAVTGIRVDERPGVVTADGVVDHVDIPVEMGAQFFDPTVVGRRRIAQAVAEHIDRTRRGDGAVVAVDERFQHGFKRIAGEGIGQDRVFWQNARAEQLVGEGT